MKLTGLSKMVSFLASSQTVLSDLDCIIGSQKVSSHSTGICDEKLLPENVKNSDSFDISGIFPPRHVQRLRLLLKDRR